MQIWGTFQKMVDPYYVPLSWFMIPVKHIEYYVAMAAAYNNYTFIQS